MRKILLVLMASVMMLALGACGASEDEDTETVSTEETTVEEESIPEEEIEESETEEVNDDISYVALLPVVEDYFSNGEVIIIDQDGGTAYVFRVTGYQDGEYEAYVEACKAMGFDDVTYEGENDGGKMFYAYSSDGTYYLQVMLGYQIEAIDVSCKTSTKDDDSSESSGESETGVIDEEDTTVSDVSDSDIRPEFKEAMDSYEAFFDEYVEFMKKYQESDDATSMLTDYANYMSQYAETIEKLSELEDEDMTTAEAAYYLEVTTRINQKILEVAQ